MKIYFLSFIAFKFLGAPLKERLRSSTKTAFRGWIAGSVEGKMSKKIVKIELDQETVLGKIKDAIGNRCVCFVLISCSEPTEEGKMEVQMHFEGDETLAAFLVESAGQAFEEQIVRRESK